MNVSKDSRICSCNEDELLSRSESLSNSKFFFFGAGWFALGRPSPTSFKNEGTPNLGPTFFEKVINALMRGPHCLARINESRDARNLTRWDVRMLRRSNAADFSVGAISFFERCLYIVTPSGQCPTPTEEVAYWRGRGGVVQLQL